MNSETSTVASPFCVLPTTDVMITELARKAAEQTQRVWDELGRRSHHRVPFPHLVPLSPLNDDGLSFVGDTIFVVGKNLATLGFDFYHHDPIPCRLAIVSLPTGPSSFVHFQMRITWCRFLKPRWYDSGGRFVKRVTELDQRPEHGSQFFSLHGCRANYTS